MEYNEFIEVVKDTVCLQSENVLKAKIAPYSPRGKDSPDFFFYNEGDVGGISGGSCWDSSVTRPYTNPEGAREAIKGFDKDFDAIIAKICPNITFLQYKDIYNSVVKTFERTENEYYGNSTDYLCVYCEVKELYNKLKEMELV